ncbi:hypothetical protein H310_01054 [Aphanomyces invadans]|uniref:Magnesium transporter n=1 Tax=Aphanomyces invadans TaxID=157072 RepID=A0A024UPY5_9STRA|nr:hypothetical protein H310_01054 [Aphanomyces invadans]ETW08481.1 hypothetical protein H310_01054 [Aphanomyces invadans]|eukprot:XP_008862286.1 hypothetical protein H310_01054 [Aphanomyces invadans]
MAKARLQATGAVKYGSFNTAEPPSWVFGKVGTPTKHLIEHDFCTSHEQGLLLGFNALTSKRMVLKFDVKGEMEYLEMARSDVLKIVQEAAQPCKDPSHLKSTPHGSASLTPIATTPRLATQRLRRRASFGQLTNTSDVQSLHMRDLRNLDDSIDNFTSITIRRHVILVHCGPLRCVVLRNALLMFVPTGADTLIQILRNKVAQCCAEDDDIAFEFRALEAIFFTLCKLLSSDCEKLVEKVSLALTRLSSAALSSGELETLTILKNKVHEFESQILDTRRILMELLDNDQDMRLLYLSKLHRNATVVSPDSMGLDVEEAEALIEAYLLDIHAMRTKVGLLQTRMVNTENIVMLKLDSVRNALLSIDTIFGMVMLAMNMAMFVSSAFGMNLVSGYETQPHLFWAVLGVSTTCAALMIYIGIRYFKAKGVILL